MLFDDVPRIDANPRGYGEPLYAFLNRVAGEYWECVRNLLSEWHRHYPEADQQVLRRRFQSPDRRGLLGAFWELYLHELFRRLDFTIELHPRVIGADRRPDFRLARGSSVLLVEAVTIYEPEGETRIDGRLAALLDEINTLDSLEFFLAVDAHAVGRHTPPLTRLTRDLQAWLAALDHDAISHGAQGTGGFRWQHQGWDLTFTPIARKPRARWANVPTIGRGRVRTGFVDDHRVIAQRLGEKTRAYGRQSREPFVIALLSFRETTGPEPVLRALFGSAPHQPDLMLAGRIGGRWPNAASGFWLTRGGPQYQDVSGIITAFELLPWSIAHSRPWFIANPWTLHPLDVELPLSRFEVDRSTGEVWAVDGGLPPHMLFDLPRDWPPGNRFPRRSD